MAFTYTITRYGDVYHLVISETNVGDSDEVEITTDAVSGLFLPVAVTVKRQDCGLGVGTATTVDPRLSRVTGAAAIPPDLVCANGTPAASTSTEGSASAFASEVTDGVPSFFHRSNANSVAQDNTVDTEYILVAIKP